MKLRNGLINSRLTLSELSPQRCFIEFGKKLSLLYMIIKINIDMQNYTGNLGTYIDSLYCLNCTCGSYRIADITLFYLDSIKVNHSFSF